MDLQKKKRFKLKEAFILFAVFLMSCLYFLSYVNHDMNIWDEGVPLNGALRMFQGERPIRDFFAYPPGRYVLYYLSMKIGGQQVTSPRIAVALLSSVFATLIWLVSKKAGLKKSALIPWALYLLTPMYYYYRFFSFSLVLMVFSLALQLIKPLTRVNACISACLALIICWFRFELGMILLAMFPILMLLNWMTRDSKSGMLAIAMPSIILYAGQISLVLYSGGIGNWLHYTRLCGNSVSGGFKQMSLSWPPLFSIEYLKTNAMFSLFQDGLFYVSGMVLVLSGLSLIRSKRFQAWHTAIVITGLTGFGLVIWRTGFGNLLRCLPPISILAVCWITHSKTYSGLKYLAGIVLFAGLLLDSIIVNPHIYQSIGVVRSVNGMLTHPRFTVNVFPSECRQISELIENLDFLKTKQYRTMMALPFNPLINFITDFENTSYYEWLLPGMFSSRFYYDGMLEEVSRHAPDIFIINDAPFDDVESRRFSKQYPELMAWILTDYYRWERAAGFDIYRRKSPSSLSLLGDFSDAVTHAAGINTISQIQGLDGKSSEILVQERGSEIRFDVPLVDSVVFYAVIVFESPSSAGRCRPMIEIRVNDIPMNVYEYDETEHYIFLTVPILEINETPTRLDLVTSCTTDSSDGYVIWLNPVFLELEIHSGYVDRYCRLP